MSEGNANKSVEKMVGGEQNGVMTQVRKNLRDQLKALERKPAHKKC